MTNQIQFVGMKHDDRLETSILEKLEKLEKKYEWIINARVFLKIEQSKDSIKDKVCEIELSVPGPNIFNKTSGEHFEAAIAEGFSDMEMLLRKFKGKMYRSTR